MGYMEAVFFENFTRKPHCPDSLSGNGQIEAPLFSRGGDEFYVAKVLVAFFVFDVVPSRSLSAKF